MRQVEGKIGPIGWTAPEDIRAFDPKIGNLINKQEGWRSHKGDPTVGQFSRRFHRRAHWWLKGSVIPYGNPINARRE